MKQPGSIINGRREVAADPKTKWPWRELAMFGSGFEAFHAMAHAYLAVAHVNLTIFGITQTYTWNVVSAAVNACIALLLARYAWRSRP